MGAGRKPSSYVANLLPITFRRRSLTPQTQYRARCDRRRGHLKAEGDEQTGSQSYIPPDNSDCSFRSNRGMEDAARRARTFPDCSSRPRHDYTRIQEQARHALSGLRGAL
jgi:hypothetical protein